MIPACRRRSCPHRRAPPPRTPPSSSRPGRRAPTRWPRPACPRTGPKAVVVVRDRGRASCATWTGRRTATPRSSRSPSTRPDGLNVLRHSTAHVLAQAVQDLFPEAKLGIGPPIENGFYYDFDVGQAVPPRRTWRSSRSGCRRSSSPGSGSPGAGSTRSTRRAAELADEPYKLELIGLKGDRGRTTERGDGGRRRRADHLRQPRRQDRRGRAGATCAAARTCRPPGISRRSS